MATKSSKSDFYNGFLGKLRKGEDLTKKELEKAIKNGFDINEKDEYGMGMTIFMHAAEYDKTETLRVLKELGADVKAKDDYGLDACMRAAECGNIEAARVLVKELGAVVDARDYDGCTAYIRAARCGKIEMARVLVEELNADVDAKDDNGRTACMYAAVNDDVKTLRVLKELGADINATDNNGMTACMFAAMEGCTNAVKVLVEELKADINAQDNKGRTACMWAAHWGNTETLLALVKLGADLTIKDKEGKTAFDYMDQETKKKVIEARKEYERNHQKTTKLAECFEQRFLIPQEKIRVTVDNGANARRGAAAFQGRG